MAVYFGVLLALPFAVWRSGKQRDGILWKVWVWFKEHPIAAAISLVVVNACGMGAQMFLFYTVRTPDLFKVYRWQQAEMLSALFVPLALAWLLIRAGRAGRSSAAMPN